MRRTPASHVQPLHGPGRKGPLLAVEQDELLLGSDGRVLQHPLQLAMQRAQLTLRNRPRRASAARGRGRHAGGVKRGATEKQEASPTPLLDPHFVTKPLTPHGDQLQKVYRKRLPQLPHSCSHHVALVPPSKLEAPQGGYLPGHSM